MIISASRRTDIPAFYSKWFMNAIDRGYVEVMNPYNHKPYKISLLKQDVDFIVFWTRNPLPMLPYLNKLDSLGYKYYFQYTITGYPKDVETNTPVLDKAIDSFIKLSKQIGKEKVIWRYDPIMVTDTFDIEYHMDMFRYISNGLQGYTDRCVISIVDKYFKIEHTLNDYKVKPILEDKESLDKLLKNFNEISKETSIRIQTCAETIELSDYDNIVKGKCIDGELIGSILGYELPYKKDPNQRKACGCVVSRDIGRYNTCIHGCTYCYATHNKEQAKKNYKEHDVHGKYL